MSGVRIRTDPEGGITLRGKLQQERLTALRLPQVTSLPSCFKQTRASVFLLIYLRNLFIYLINYLFNLFI